MAPEQAENSFSLINDHTDLYTLGAILYELLTLRCPISGGSVQEMLQKTIRGAFPQPSELAPSRNIPAALDAITMKAMQCTPGQRYSTVSGLIRDIQQYQDGFATEAENPTFFTHLHLLIKRHRLAVSLIVGFSALIVAILGRTFVSIHRSERIARHALADVQQRKDYIAATARRVAPDYLDLTMQLERSHDFVAAAEALNTGLAFDLSLDVGWVLKAKLLLSQQQFSAAWEILTREPALSAQVDSGLLTLAEKYRLSPSLSDVAIPGLLRDFREHGMASGIPRVFHHINRQSFDPASRFPAIAESLRVLNPAVKELNFSWKKEVSGRWAIDISDNPQLDDISPLTGLDIQSLNANNTGTLDLTLIEREALRELKLARTPLTHLPDLGERPAIHTFDLRGTRIRNLATLVQYPHLTQLDISDIQGLSTLEPLLWCPALTLLSVSETHRNDFTLQALAGRGVIIIYCGRQQ